MTICEDAMRSLNTYFSNSVICGPEEAGYQVLVSPFVYPDRDNIEVFIRRSDDGHYLISDLGQTLMKLDSTGFVLQTGLKRRAMIHQITSSMRVRYENGTFLIDSNEGDVGERTMDLLIALQRLSDLAFTVNQYTTATFNDEFENYVASKSLRYNRGVTIDLPQDRGRFVADFVIEDTKIVQLLHANSPGHAAERRNRVYYAFGELLFGNDPRERLAVVDNRNDVWGTVPLEGLGHVTTNVLLWTQKPVLDRVLRAIA